MKPIYLVYAVISILAAVGCHMDVPTAVSPINNSGKFVTGTIVIRSEQIPFASLSNYAGFEKFQTGDTVEANIVDVWSDQRLHLTSKVPPCPTDDPYPTLLVELDKTQNLKVYWKTEVGFLQDIHLKQYYRNFNCLPIVVANHSPRKDYLIKMKQGSYSYRFQHTDSDANGDSLYYGFLHQGEGLPEGVIFVSYVQGPVLETTFCKLPTNIKDLNPDVTALFLDITKDQEFAKLFLLKGTSTNPRLIAADYQSQFLPLPQAYTEFKTFRTNSEVRKYGFRLPDSADLE